MRELAADREEHVVFERPPAVPGVELMSVQRSTRLWCAYHETYTFCVIPREGNPPHVGADWLYRRRTQRVGAGGVMLMEPGEVHVTKAVFAPATFWVAQVSPEVVAPVAQALQLPPRPQLVVAQVHDAHFLEPFLRFRQAHDEGASALEIQARLLACIRGLLERCAEREPQPRTDKRGHEHPGLIRARDYIREDCTAEVSLADLERVSGLSRHHLIRTFARAFGLPPHAYQTHLRIHHAREQLRAGLRPAEVDVGFADQSHLTRRFKRALGVTPAGYARLISPNGARPETGQQERSRPTPPSFSRLCRQSVRR